MKLGHVQYVVMVDLPYYLTKIKMVTYRPLHIMKL